VLRADLLATAASNPRDCCAACQHKGTDGAAVAASSGVAGAGTSQTAPTAAADESAGGTSKTGVKAGKAVRAAAAAAEAQLQSEERLEPLASVLLSAIGLRS
jgi:hypothetical protein